MLNRDEEYIITFNPEEYRKIQKFEKKHTEKCKRSTHLRIHDSSGIGTSAFIHCDGCGKFKDVTDYSTW